MGFRLAGSSGQRPMFVCLFICVGPDKSMTVNFQRKPVDGLAVGLATLLTFCWGLQQVAIKASAHEISPMLQVSLRSIVAGALVLLINHFWLKQKWNPAVKFKHAAGVAIFFAGEFFFVAQGLLYTTASHMAVLLNTAPLFAAVILGIKLPEERLSRLQWLGILTAFAGVAMTFIVPSLMGSADDLAHPYWLLGDLFGLIAGLSWGLSIVVIRLTPLASAPATQMLFWQLLGGFVLLFPAALMIDGQHHWEPAMLGYMSMTFQILVVCVGSYLVWCWMLTKYLASRLSSLALLSPMFGVLLGVLILDDPLHPAFIGGALMVLMGLIIVQADARIRRFFKRRHQ